MGGPLRDETRRGPGALKHLPPLWVPPWVPEALRPEAERQIRAWHHKREADIAALLHRIDSGTSSISFGTGWNDPRPLGAPRGNAQAEKKYAEQLKQQARQLLSDLAHTEAGFKLLSDLDASSFRLHVQSWSGDKNDTSFTARNLADAYELNGRPGKGSGATISINASLTTFAGPGEVERPWMTERVKYGFYHELVHAWHGIHGMVARGDHRGQPKAEFQAVGLGTWAKEPITENAIRKQMGKEARPDVNRVTF
jgi:hypothetical protein